MESINALMAGCIDYAGLFPPANLDMATAVKNYANYRETDEFGMLARIVIPISRFDEFEDLASPYMTTVPAAVGSEIEPDPWSVIALVSPASDDESLINDLERIEAFNDAHALEGQGAAIVDTIELKAENGSEIDSVLELLDDDIFPYFELNPSGDIRGALAALAGLDGGVKIRTGGVTPDLHPSPSDTAKFIDACCTADVPFKATAGLHHPLRHYAETVGAKQFGFLNVFLGACLRNAGRIDCVQLQQLLEDEDMSSFEFTDEHASWKEKSITLDGIDTARSRIAHSFGSCSFTEPVNDLCTLGILEPETTE